MKVYTYSEARQNLAALLDTAHRDGAVKIRRRDGRVYVLRPEPSAGSLMDVEAVDLSLTSREIVDIVREGRER